MSGRSKSGSRPDFWRPALTRAEMDQRRPEVGDRVWCGGHPFVIEYINADRSLGVVYDPPRRPQQNESSR